VVGPDRDNKHDSHANIGFQYEGNLLREFIASQDNMVVVCGDRHWQYVSVDSTHGVKEYSSGPASDKHAGGWKNDMLRPEHKYLNVIGGFLAMTIERQDETPVLIARHHGVDGKVLNEDRVVAK
jgi:alkaline phosphatase D